MNSPRSAALKPPSGFGSDAAGLGNELHKSCQGGHLIETGVTNRAGNIITQGMIFLDGQSYLGIDKIIPGQGIIYFFFQTAEGQARSFNIAQQRYIYSSGRRDGKVHLLLVLTPGIDGQGEDITRSNMVIGLLGQ